MRITICIEDDVVEAARRLAAAEERSLGEVVSALARRGLLSMAPDLRERGFPVFHVATNAPLFTAEMVRRALDDSQ